jgi:adenylate cyclase
VGIIGSSTQGKYGVLGDTVNLGSRLQGLTREYGVGILVSDAWVALAGSGFYLRELDSVTVKGRSSQVTIFELIGLAEAPHEPSLKALTQAWQQALDAWRGGDLAACATAVGACLELCPHDGPALRLQRLLSAATHQ